MKLRRLPLLKGTMVAILLTLCCDLSSARGQVLGTKIESRADKTSSLLVTGASSEERFSSNGQSERERLWPKRLDKQDCGLAKAYVRVGSKSGIGADSAVAMADASSSLTGVTAQPLVKDVSTAPSEDPPHRHRSLNGNMAVSLTSATCSISTIRQITCSEVAARPFVWTVCF